MNIDEIGILHKSLDGDAVVFPVEFVTGADDVGKMTPTLDGDGLPVKVSGLAAADDVGVLIPAADGEGLALKYAAANPCAEDEREMLVTVTGASGTINWCGQTWVLPGESGVEKSVCGSYVNNQYKEDKLGGEYYVGQEFWYFTGLWIERRYGVTVFSGSWQDGGNNHVRLQVYYYQDLIDFSGSGSLSTRPSIAGFPSYSYLNSYWGVMNTGDAPTYNDYKLLPKQYQNTVINAGISYSWRKGAGW